MKHSLRKRNNIMIGALCAVLLLMIAGYAAFSTRLDISSGASVNSKWDIEITNIRGANPNGGDAYDINPPTFTKTSANFSTGLKTPNTRRFYEVEISNLGNLAGSVTIGNLSCGDNSAIQCMAATFDVKILDDQGEIAEITTEPNGLMFENGQNDYSSVGFSIEPGQKHYLYIVVIYNDVTSQPENLNANIQLNLTYEQGIPSETTPDPTPAPTPEPTPEPSLTTVYDYYLLDWGDNPKTIGITKLNATEYVTDYTQLDSYKSGKTWFLKYDIDAEGIIQNAYACQKFSFIDEPVCLQGGNVEYYSANKTILESLKPTFESNSGSCSLGDSDSNCSVGVFRIEANSNGRVSQIMDPISCDENLDYCGVTGDGAYCSVEGCPV